MADKIKPERMRPEDYAPEGSPMSRGATYIRKEVVSKGVGFGSALAIVISFNTHQSIIWAMIHGVFSWLYVIYFALTR
ncbi:hypothetical protein [Parasphingorhabdus sp.]|jgi:hypothetical protein|uniref:hypothetical protein n=1 Tax=Parasphingorhabdus sp. TaxID=2709688 RepID=UPI0009EDB98B